MSTLRRRKPRTHSPLKEQKRESFLVLFGERCRGGSGVKLLVEAQLPPRENQSLCTISPIMSLQTVAGRCSRCSPRGFSRWGQ